jgi:hypothetical protein
VSEPQFLRELITFSNTGSFGNVLVSVPDLKSDADRLDELHRRFRADLQALVDNNLSASDRRRIYNSADRVLMAPHTGDDGVVLYQYVPENADAVIAYALRLLLDPTKGHDADLKQCQWKDCNRIEDARQLPHVRKFFFVSERREMALAAGKQVTGKLPDRYCSELHMLDAHRARATEATIKRRKELRARKEAKAAAKSAAKHK